MKKVITILLAAVILLSATGCGVKITARHAKDIDEESELAGNSKTVKKSEPGEELGPDEEFEPGERFEPTMESSEDLPAWCSVKNATKWIQRYVMHDTSEPYSVEKLLGIVSFKGKRYAAADMQLWSGGFDGGIMTHCGTIYFNEDGSDIWVHMELYEGYGTEYHIVNGEVVEEIEFP